MLVMSAPWRHYLDADKQAPRRPARTLTEDNGAPARTRGAAAGTTSGQPRPGNDERSAAARERRTVSRAAAEMDIRWLELCGIVTG